MKNNKTLPKKQSYKKYINLLLFFLRGKIQEYTHLFLKTQGW